MRTAGGRSLPIIHGCRPIRTSGITSCSTNTFTATPVAVSELHTRPDGPAWTLSCCCLATPTPNSNPALSPPRRTFMDAPVHYAHLPEPVMPRCPPQKLLLGQKALVTGASSGIGRAIAVSLADAG